MCECDEPKGNSSQFAAQQMKREAFSANFNSLAKKTSSTSCIEQSDKILNQQFVVRLLLEL
jgi:hypothetical protein